MQHYYFIGTIHPSEGSIGLRHSGRFHVGFGDTLEPTDGHIVIKGSKVRVSLQADSTVPVQMVANCLRAALAVLIDAQGFVDGRGRSVELISGKNLLTGEDYIWSGEVPELATAWEGEPLSTEEVLEAAHRDQRFADALGDFRRAITDPWDTGFYCYRAVEMTMRHWLEHGSASRHEAWSAMRKHLRVDRDSLREIERWGGLQRHGGRETVTSADHVSLLITTRLVLERMARHLLESDANTDCSAGSNLGS